MYFTRSDTGFRGWFQVVRGNGTLRTDITGSDFTALIVDANDTTSSLMTVTQSAQKQGLYRFDVPSSFLVGNGSGEYGVSVELNTSTPPNVVTAFSEILKVSQDDFDSLSGSISVSGSFTVDVDSIVTGVWEANRLNFTSSVDSMGWTIDRMFQTQSLTYENTVDLVFSSSQIFNIVTDVSANIDHLIFSSSQIYNNTNTIITNIGDLLFSSSQIYNDTQHISSSVDNIYSDTQNLIFSSSQIYNETQNLIFSSSLIYGDTQNILGDLLTVVSATVSGATLTQVGIDSVVSGVWNAVTSTFNLSGTMGWLQNQTYGSVVVSSSLIYQNTNDLIFSSSQIFNNTETIVANSETIISSSSQILSSVQVLLTGNTDLLFSSSQIYDNTVTLIDTTNNLIFSSSQIFNNTEQLLASGSDITQTGINSLVSGVWNAVSSTFNLSGTMGWLQNQTYETSQDLVFSSSQIFQNTENIITDLLTVVSATTSGATLNQAGIDAVVSGVWNAVDTTFNTSGTMGYLENLIDEIRFDTAYIVVSGTGGGGTVSGAVDLSVSSVNTIISGVWEAASASFNTSGTMGWLQNQTYTNTVDILDDTILLISGVNAILGQTTNIQDIVASGSVNISLDSINTFVSSVWQANDATFNTSGTMGWLQNLIDDIRTESSQNSTTLNFISSSVVDISSSVINIENGGTVVSATLTPAGVTQVVSGVWNAASGTYEASGTMGWLQNQIVAASASLSASVTVDNQAIADAVWNTLTSSMTVSGSAGAVLFTQTDALATKICEIYQILGLELGSPLTVSDVQRTVAAITQSISCVNDVVTVTRTS